MRVAEGIQPSSSRRPVNLMPTENLRLNIPLPAPGEGGRKIPPSIREKVMGKISLSRRGQPPEDESDAFPEKPRYFLIERAAGS